MFTLVDSPHVAKVASGMTAAEAQQLVSAMPFELAVVIRPALVDPATMTTLLLTAHLIIFWLSQDSNVTPPVCLAAFTAAGIAGSPPMATGFQAWKIAKGLYIVPVLFAYTPFLGGDWIAAAIIFAFALVGIYGLAGALQGWMEARLAIVPRASAGAAGLACLWPNALLVNLAGAAVVAAIFVLNLRGARTGRV